MADAAAPAVSVPEAAPAPGYMVALAAYPSFATSPAPPSSSDSTQSAYSPSLPQPGQVLTAFASFNGQAPPGTVQVQPVYMQPGQVYYQHPSPTQGQAAPMYGQPQAMYMVPMQGYNGQPTMVYAMAPGYAPQMAVSMGPRSAPDSQATSDQTPQPAVAQPAEKATAGPVSPAPKLADMPRGSISQGAGPLQAGILKVTVKSAWDLQDLDCFKKQDPYVKVICGKAENRTTAAKGGGTRPLWLETLVFHITDETVITLEIWEEDRFKKDDVLGVAHVELANARRDGDEHVQATLWARNKNVSVGFVSARLEFEANEGVGKGAA